MRIPESKKTAKQTVLSRLLGLTLPVLDELMSFAAGHGALLEYVSKDFFLASRPSSFPTRVTVLRHLLGQR